MNDVRAGDVLVSLDIDWAADEIIEDSLALLDQYGIRATLFMTHRPSVDCSRHELGLHPNFTDSDLRRPLSELLDIFPDAHGTRSHSLFFSYRLVEIYNDLGIRFQSNVIAYKKADAGPFSISARVTEVPIFLMDNIHMEMEPHSTFDDKSLALEQPGLKVYDFHPIHIFLNTEVPGRYVEAKKWYRDPKRLAEMRNTARPGTRDLFVALLRALAIRKEKSFAIGDWFSGNRQ